MKNVLLIAAIGCCVIGVHAGSENAEYMYSQPYTSGAATINTQAEYVYTSPLHDGRILGSSAYTAGKVPRQTYDLYSAYREAALWQIREDKRVALIKDHQSQALHQLTKHSHPSKRHRHCNDRHETQAKVILLGEKTCVPQVEFATSQDWKNHLVCWESGVNHVE